MIDGGLRGVPMRRAIALQRLADPSKRKRHDTATWRGSTAIF